MESETQFIATLFFAFSITLPIFVIVLLGVVLKYFEFINAEFVRIASNLVFNVGLPVMLFISSVRTDFAQLVNIRHIVVLVGMTLAVCLLSWLTAYWHVADKHDHGVYVQGAFRGNLIIVGLAFCANAYGDAGLAVAALPTAIIIILYNVLAVYILNSTLSHRQGDLAGTVIGIVKNPLIIGILLGLLVNLSGIAVPELVIQTGDYLSNMTLPLALLCIGGTLNLLSLRESLFTAVASSCWKLVASPLIACLLALLLGLRDDDLGVIFLLAASPTAAASFIMVKAMGGNSGLAANIVLITTLGSVITVTGGLLVLKFIELI